MTYCAQITCYVYWLTSKTHDFLDLNVNSFLKLAYSLKSMTPRAKSKFAFIFSNQNRLEKIFLWLAKRPPLRILLECHIPYSCKIHVRFRFQIINSLSPSYCKQLVHVPSHFITNAVDILASNNKFTCFFPHFHNNQIARSPLSR